MADVVPFSKLETYPEIYVGRGYLQATRLDGLITPIVAYKSGEIHHVDRERYEAFRRQAVEIGVVSDVIIVWFEELIGDDLVGL